MKVHLKLILFCIVVISLFSQCTKDNEVFNSYFCSNIKSNDGHLMFYVNDVYKGELPYLEADPNCNNDSLKHKSLFLSLKSGKYKLAIKDEAGVVKTSIFITISSNVISSSPGEGQGGMFWTTQDNCTMFKFLE